MLKHYEENFVKEFMGYFHKNLENYKEEKALRIQETRFYNHLYEEIKYLRKKINNIYELQSHNALSQLLLKNCDKKIIFWGASLFLKEYLQNNDLSNLNILGVIDKSATSIDKLNTLKVYAPSELKNLNADIVISTIKNSNKEVYEQIQEYLTTNNIKAELMPNIFY